MKNLILLAFLVLALTAFHSCSPIIQVTFKKKLTEENGSIPPDFGKNKSILIVTETSDEKYNKYIKKIAKKKYTGEHIVVDEWDLQENNKYTDTDMYRYQFTYGKGSEYVSVSSGRTAFTTRRFFVLDRKERKIYPSKLTSSYWGAVARAYLTNLDKKRLSMK